jgi:hypothetical protein
VSYAATKERPPIVDVRDICEKLNRRVGELVRDLLPNGRPSQCKRWWEADNIGDPPTDAHSTFSFKVNLGGAWIGQYKDFATGEKGDLLDLVMHRNFAGNKADAIKWAKSYLQMDDMDPARVAQSRRETAERTRTFDEDAALQAEVKKRGARTLWLSGQPIDGTPAARYLEARGISLERLGHWPNALRYHAEVYHKDARVKLPCMLAMMVTPDGAHVATHRTFLARCPSTRRWVKAENGDVGVPAKQSKMVIGKSGGSFVPLRKGASQRSMKDIRQLERVDVTEGIEDGLTIAMARPDLRVLAGYSLSNLGVIEFPKDRVGPLVLVCDRDNVDAVAGGAGRQIDTLERAIARQQARGIRVQIVMPPIGTKDFNAWLQALSQQSEKDE